MSNVLYRATTTGVSLPGALTLLKNRPAVGLFIAPGWCGFGQIDSEAQVIFAKTGLRLADVYEARLFNEAVELRWWNDPVDGKHRVAVLAEEPIKPAGWQVEESSVGIAGTIDQTYLLWGRTQASSSLPTGWTRLTTARIGALDVPAEGGTRFEIHVREYLKIFDDGNVAVAEERLLAVRPFDGEESKS